MKVLTIIGMALLCLPLSAQQTVRGSIFDKDSKVPLLGAVVQIAELGSSFATTSDSAGNFSINEVPTGRISLEVSYLGYESIRMEELLVSNSKELIINVAMQETINQLEVVEVRSTRNGEPLNELSTVSSLSFTMEALKRQPANFADPARMALNFPGVMLGGEDLLNDLVIRGNAPSGMLWRLEGIEIPNPNHFATRGGSGGGITMLSANAMASSDFFSGAFPAEYGNALSGVMDIKMRKGNTNKKETSLQIGLLGLDLATEGPFSKNYEGSYMVNFRYSTLGILDQIGLNPSGGTIPDFQDLSFKIHLPTSKLGTFSIFGLGGHFIEEELSGFFPQDLQAYKDEGLSGIVGVSNLFFLSKNTYLKTIYAKSYSQLDFEESFGPELIPRYEEQFIDQSDRVSLLLNHKFSARHMLRMGGIVSRLSYELILREENYDIVDNNGFPEREYNGSWRTILDNQGQTNLFQAYAQLKSKLTAALTLNLGIHFTHFQLNENSLWEPRFGLKYQLNENQELSFGAGLHSRQEALPLYFIHKELEDGSTIQPYLQLPLQQSKHLVLGYRNKLNTAWSIHSEIYFQHLENLPVSNNPSSTLAALNVNFFDLLFQDDVLVGQGEGLNYGIDINIDRRFYRQYYLIANASLLRSKFKTLEGQWHHSRYSTGYNFLLTGGKDWMIGKKKTASLGFNVRFLLNGGQRYTPIDTEQSIAQMRTILSNRIFSQHLPTYFRADVGLNYRLPARKVLHFLSLNIQNVSNTLNVFERVERYNELEPDKVRTLDFIQTGLIPILNYRIEF